MYKPISLPNILQRRRQPPNNGKLNSKPNRASQRIASKVPQSGIAIRETTHLVRLARPPKILCDLVVGVGDAAAHAPAYKEHDDEEDPVVR
jgi:hypothetical protein